MHERPLVEVGGAAGRDDRIGSLGGGRVPDRHQAAQDRRIGRDRRQSRRSISIIARRSARRRCCRRCSWRCEDPNSSSSNCGEGYSCSYTNSISWIELPTPPDEPTPRTSPLPMELNPQVVFERLFGSGATPEVRAARMRRTAASSIRSSASWRPAEELGASRPPHRQPVHRRDPRDRAAHSARGEGVERRARDRLLPTGHPGAVRRAHQAAFRSDRAGLPRRHHARGDAARRARPHRPQLPVPEERALPERRRQRQLPRRLAPSGRSGADPPLRGHQPLSRLDARLLRREAEVDSRRRRHAARPLADPVRHQHGQLESASALRRAAHSRRRRQRPAQRQPPPRLRAQDGDDRQPAAERPRHVRDSQGQQGDSTGRLAKL